MSVLNLYEKECKQQLEYYDNELNKVQKQINDLWEVGKTSKSKERRKDELNIIIDYYDNELIKIKNKEKKERKE